MSSGWLGEMNYDDMPGEEQSDSFYCPYTNTAQCALIQKGLQPQELCLALECEQMKLVRRNSSTRKQDRAA